MCRSIHLSACHSAQTATLRSPSRPAVRARTARSSRAHGSVTAASRSCLPAAGGWALGVSSLPPNELRAWQSSADVARSVAAPGPTPRLFRPCSVVGDWSSGLIPSRITSLIYIDFDELERIHVYSCESEQALRKPRPKFFSFYSFLLLATTTVERPREFAGTEIAWEREKTSGQCWYAAPSTPGGLYRGGGTTRYV
jgi:hypothetical protein